MALVRKGLKVRDKKKSTHISSSIDKINLGSRFAIGDFKSSFSDVHIFLPSSTASSVVPIHVLPSLSLGM